MQETSGRASNQPDLAPTLRQPDQDARPGRGARTDLPPVAVRFAGSYEVRADGCWEWKLSRLRGYGLFSIKHRNRFAHRVSWELANGRPIPEGLTIDHLCRNTWCVNPDHLEPVTIRENIFRSPIAQAVINAAKDECDSGHPFTADNTYIRPNGNRTCRTCNRAAVRRYKARVAA